ncbi:MAG: tyrosine-type recombinase/integrase [Crenarchaeota archaeon]|nr:tyrosine-type recombinase/integrase [Thermoproteota archaeon]
MSRQKPSVRDHIRKAIRLYLHFVRRKDLLDLFSYEAKGEDEDEGEPAIGLDEFYDILTVAKTINKNYAVYLAGLLVTGLRPYELRSLTWNDQADIDPRIFRLRVMSRRKRAYYAFLTPGLLDVLEKTKITGSPKLFHYSHKTERKVLKAIRRLKPGFRPYDLRSLNTYILYQAGIDWDTIRFMHGWISRKTWWKYYLRKHVTKEQALLETLRLHNQVFQPIDQKITEILGW